MSKYQLSEVIPITNNGKVMGATLVYKSTKNVLEQNHTITIFEEGILDCLDEMREIEADVVNYKLDGVYENVQTKKRTTSITSFYPKCNDGTYPIGMSPREQHLRQMQRLIKVDER